MEYSLFDVSVIMCVMSGFVVGGPLSGAAFLVIGFVMGGLLVASECSVFYGVLFSLTYISAMLVLFLFFVGLSPCWSSHEESLELRRLQILSGGVGFMEGVLALLYGTSGQVEGGMGLSSPMIFCTDVFGWFMVILSFYLFLLIVGCSKLASRDGGALRNHIY